MIETFLNQPLEIWAEEYSQLRDTIEKYFSFFEQLQTLSEKQFTTLDRQYLFIEEVKDGIHQNHPHPIKLSKSIMHNICELLHTFLQYTPQEQLNREQKNIYSSLQEKLHAWYSIRAHVKKTDSKNKRFQQEEKLDQPAEIHNSQPEEEALHQSEEVFNKMKERLNIPQSLEVFTVNQEEVIHENSEDICRDCDQ